MSFAVSEKVALVTGANRGIGRVIVESLLERGAAKVYAAVRSSDSVSELVATHGDKVVPVQLDLTQPDSIVAAAQVASDVDLVVNNAGVLRTSSVLSEDALESLEFELNGNLLGLLRMARAFAPVLKNNGGGAFVQLNSVVSVKAFEQFATYSASKAAAYNITQSLRNELREQGTQVVSVHPGPIATDMGDAAGLTEIAEPASLVADAIVDALQDGRFHAWAGTMAQQVGTAYENFATAVVEADMSEG
ncbi:MAG: SDR family oxidoreductase [Planctomycetaceae bacterium]|nr:SDR family oxidoreductase [Planctomycetaceae bacterium]